MAALAHSAKNKVELSELRQRAKEILEQIGTEPPQGGSLDNQHLLEELNVYHIELELQNEELQKTRNKLEASQKYLDDLFAYAPVGYVVMTIDGKIHDVNERAAKYFQVERKILVGQRLQSFVPHDSLIQYNKCLTALLDQNIPQYTEVLFRVHGGRSFWARIDQFLIKNPTGSGSLILCSVLDISKEKKAEHDLVDLNHNLESLVRERTSELQEANLVLEQEVKERKLAEAETLKYAERQSTLLREIHHRVKNNMQIVISLIKLQSKQITNADALMALQESQNRIRALAMIHEILYQAEDLSIIPFKQYLQKLTRHIAIAYNVKQKSIHLDVTTTVTSCHIDQAVPLGLIITELVTNAIKYGFLDGDSGEVYISVNSENEDGIKLIVRDTGVGLPKGFIPQESNSLGLRLVYRIAQDQLNGTININHDKGTEVIVQFKKKLL